MENFRLLEKHKKKLSLYFALFILFSLWLIQGIFLLSIFFSENSKLENKLLNKYSWVVNILNNKDAYFKEIKENNFTTRLLVEKTLEWVTIIENGKKILWDINSDLLWDKQIIDSKHYKFYQNQETINSNNYKIIIKTENSNSYYNYIIWYLYFLTYSLPFWFLFYKKIVIMLLIKTKWLSQVALIVCLNLLIVKIWLRQLYNFTCDNISVLSFRAKIA